MLTPGPEVGHLVIQTANALTHTEQLAQQFVAERMQFIMEHRWLIGALVGAAAVYDGIMQTWYQGLFPRRRASAAQQVK